MLRELLYALDCDFCRVRFGQDDNPFTLRDRAARVGWMLKRRRDGRYARSGGKDYCPACIPESWGDDIRRNGR